MMSMTEEKRKYRITNRASHREILKADELLKEHMEPVRDGWVFAKNWDDDRVVEAIKGFSGRDVNVNSIRNFRQKNYPRPSKVEKVVKLKLVKKMDLGDDPNVMTTLLKLEERLRGIEEKIEKMITVWQ